MNQDHIIQKVFIEITVNNKEKALSLKDDVNSFLSIDVFPQIEKYINALEYKLAGQTLQIPTLELNVDVKSSALNTELKDKIAQVFKEELSEITKPIEDQNQFQNQNQEAKDTPLSYLMNSQEKLFQTFIHFLEKGSMPWWNSGSNNISILESVVFDQLIAADNFQQKMVSVLSKEHVRNRIINQFSDEQIMQLCLAVLKNKELEIKIEEETIYQIAKLNHKDKVILWQLILNVISKSLNTSDKNNLREYLLQQISRIEQSGSRKIKANHNIGKTIVKIFPFIKIIDLKENETQENRQKSTIDKSENLNPQTEAVYQNDLEVQEDTSQDEGLYIQNAGLILIHPFIKPLFEDCNLLHPETRELTDPELGAHLLHYIATGKTNAPECNMIFEKFLCNIPMHQTINRHIKLSRKHKKQAKNVIESVQHNWSSMKKSSAELLQNEFFQRSGKLVITDYDYTVTIERKTQDILLEKLSWGIGLIKLPWQEKFMYVNW